MDCATQGHGDEHSAGALTLLINRPARGSSCCARALRDGIKLLRISGARQTQEIREFQSSGLLAAFDFTGDPLILSTSGRSACENSEGKLVSSCSRAECSVCQLLARRFCGCWTRWNWTANSSFRNRLRQAWRKSRRCSVARQRLTSPPRATASSSTTNRTRSSFGRSTIVSARLSACAACERFERACDCARVSRSIVLRSFVVRALSVVDSRS